MRIYRIWPYFFEGFVFFMVHLGRPRKALASATLPGWVCCYTVLRGSCRPRAAAFLAVSAASYAYSAGGCKRANHRHHMGARQRTNFLIHPIHCVGVAAWRGSFSSSYYSVFGVSAFLLVPAAYQLLRAAHAGARDSLTWRQNGALRGGVPAFPGTNDTSTPASV